MTARCTLIVLAATAALAAVVSAARADVLYLNDGTTIEGDVRRTPDGYVVVGDAGKSTNVAADRVRSIELRKPVPGGGRPDAAAERLASLRRSLDATADARAAVGRLQKFVDDPANAAAADAATKELGVWQDRLDRGLVRQNGQWVTPEQKAQSQAASYAAATAARDQLRSGKPLDAERTIAAALADDPRSPPLLYLRGVTLFNADKIVPARQAFEAVNALLPADAPTLNNLAVIHWRQRAYPAAMIAYAAAMQASPADRSVLDNVAEALAALPDENRDSPPAKRAAALFAEQDAQLQKVMSAAGYFRWGAGWVNAQQLDALKIAQAKTQEQLDSLQKDFDQTKFRLGQIDNEGETNLRQMHRIEAESYIVDPQTNVRIQLAYPQSYYELQEDNVKLKKERDAALQHMEDVRAQSQKVQQTFPVAKFTGVQRLIGPEGMPGAPTLSTPPSESGSAGPAHSNIFR